MKDRIVRFCDLKPDMQLDGEITDAFHDVIGSGSYILGEQVKSFEEEFADYIGVKHCIAVGNGFDALQIALRACDIGTKPGDYVVVPSNAPLPTWMAVSEVGATPALMEPNHDMLIDPEITGVFLDKVKAVIPVHLYGAMVDVERMRKIIPPWKIIIEDCAQAHGAQLKGKMAGSLGNAGCWSFYPTKNLGCYGDGGAITTNSDEIAERSHDLRFYGQGRYRGVNSRLDEMQAAFLRVKLRYLDGENEKRVNRAARYRANLHDNKGIALPRFSQDDVYHQYVIRVFEGRNELQDHLGKAGVETKIHYPLPCHRTRYYADYEYDASVADWLSLHVLSLPIASATMDEIDYVCEKIWEFCK